MGWRELEGGEGLTGGNGVYRYRPQLELLQRLEPPLDGRVGHLMRLIPKLGSEGRNRTAPKLPRVKPLLCRHELGDH
jgi:hypothetical protein